MHQFYKPHIYVWTPVSPRDPFVHCDVMKWSWQFMTDDRFVVTQAVRQGAPLENNQHQTIKHFLEEEYDFWLSIDADNPPMRNPLELCVFDYDIVTCPTPIHKWKKENVGACPFVLNGFTSAPEKDAYVEAHPRQAIQEVDAIGGGCMMIARRVFEHPDLQYQPFARKADPDGIYNRGNDLSFCERAKEAGFKVWAHYGYQCDHFRPVSMHSVWQAFDAWYKNLEKRKSKNGDNTVSNSS